LCRNRARRRDGDRDNAREMERIVRIVRKVRRDRSKQ